MPEQLLLSRKYFSFNEELTLKMRVISVDEKDKAQPNGYVFAIRGSLIRVVFDDNSIRDVHYTQLCVEKDASDEIAQYVVGDSYVTEAGAPGIGRTIYEITRIDSEGMWAKIVEDTVRILEPWEVI